MSDFQYMPTTSESTAQQHEGFHVGASDDIMHPDYFNHEGVLELVPIIFSRDPQPYEYDATTYYYD